MSLKKYNFSLDQGTTVSVAIEVTDANNNPINLSGYTAASQMRKTYASTNSYPFTASSNSAGYINLSMNSFNSAILTPGRYVYDVEMTSTANGNITRMVEGFVTVTPQVTR